MKYIEKHPMIMIVVGVLGISMSAIFVRYSTAPSALTAACRLMWTVILMSSVVIGKEGLPECSKRIISGSALCVMVRVIAAYNSGKFHNNCLYRSNLGSTWFLHFYEG